MHDTAMEFGDAFFKEYLVDANGLKIVDIGSQDVNGSLKSLMPTNNEYIGVDFVKGRGVDIVISDPYSLPFENESVDVVVSSSCFEHSEFFWLLFNETLRILKPTGLLYINVPSNCEFHRWPVDCWRFYPDSGIALQNWGKRSGFNPALLESFIEIQKGSGWNDFVAVFCKDEKYVSKFTNRIQFKMKNYTNGHLYGHNEITHFVQPSQDQDARNKLYKITDAISAILGT